MISTCVCVGGLVYIGHMLRPVTGSVLVFLPGISEISKMKRLLESYDKPADGPGLRVLALHGSLSANEQKRVFDSAPRGIIKVVLATKVAEASVTIPDVDVVIDSCLVKELEYDMKLQVRVVVWNSCVCINKDFIKYIMSETQV